MKLSNTMLMVAAMASSASAAKTISAKNAAKVLRNARRLEDADADAEAEDEYAFLTKYNLKLIGCKAGETVVDAETGEYEYNAAIVRLCPSESGCDSDATLGCKSGYGDFVVGLNTFVENYFEDQKDNMDEDNGDDQFDINRFSECAEYEVEGDDDNAVQYFIGPTCTSDGEDVQMAVFDDEVCTYKSETSFETISNGWSLPYSDGGMVSTYCMDCLAYDEDEGAYDLRDMCMQTYENAAYKCEENMEYYSYYGQTTDGCETIEALLPKAQKGNGGKVFGWIVFVAIIGGLAGYVMWWRKKKSAGGASDGVVA